MEKRKHPRIDTSRDNNWEIRIYNSKGKPQEGRIVNVSVGGVAFESGWESVSKTIRRNSARVEIHMPDGNHVAAYSTFLRVKPRMTGDTCVCVLRLSDMTQRDFSALAHFVP